MKLRLLETFHFGFNIAWCVFNIGISLAILKFGLSLFENINFRNIIAIIILFAAFAINVVVRETVNNLIDRIEHKLLKAG